MARDNLEDWSQEWHDGDSRIITLKKKLTDLENSMGTAVSNTSALSSSMDSLDNNLQTIMKNQAAMARHINLLHLCLAKKITPEEMSNLLGMFESVDEENHVIAQETVNNLLKQS